MLPGLFFAEFIYLFVKQYYRIPLQCNFLEHRMSVQNKYYKMPTDRTVTLIFVLNTAENVDEITVDCSIEYLPGRWGEGKGKALDSRNPVQN